MKSYSYLDNEIINRTSEILEPIYMRVSIYGTDNNKIEIVRLTNDDGYRSVAISGRVCLA